jgi:hypothetical protein
MRSSNLSQNRYPQPGTRIYFFFNIVLHSVFNSDITHVYPFVQYLINSVVHLSILLPFENSSLSLKIKIWLPSINLSLTVRRSSSKFSWAPVCYNVSATQLHWILKIYLLSALNYILIHCQKFFWFITLLFRLLLCDFKLQRYCTVTSVHVLGSYHENRYFSNVSIQISVLQWLDLDKHMKFKTWFKCNLL